VVTSEGTVKAENVIVTMPEIDGITYYQTPAVIGNRIISILNLWLLKVTLPLRDSHTSPIS
jgi:hypothetical protein